MGHRLCPECKTTVIFGIQYICKKCQDKELGLMEQLRIQEENHQADLEDEYYREQEENSRTPQ